MAWELRFTPRAQKALAKLDRAVASRILLTLERNLSAHEDPRGFGSALAGELSGLWRYRIGDYRVIARIEDAVVTVVVIDVAHRSAAYR